MFQVLGVGVVLVAGGGEKFDVGSVDGGWCNPETMYCDDCTDDMQCESEDAICDNGACVTPCADPSECDATLPICDPDAGYCVGCIDHPDCAEDEFCEATLCVADICVPGELACVTGDIRICNEVGDAWELVEICPEGMTCSDDSGEPECVTSDDPTGEDSGGEDPTGGAPGGSTGGSTGIVSSIDTNSESNGGQSMADDGGCGCNSGGPASAGLGLLLFGFFRRRS